MSYFGNSNTGLRYMVYVLNLTYPFVSGSLL